MDIANWISRAVEFVNRLNRLPGEVSISTDVAPPMAAQDVGLLADSLRLGLPHQLRLFLTQGSSRFHFKYWWKPPKVMLPQLDRVFPFHTFIWGGGTICDAAKLRYYQSECYDSALSWQDSPADCIDMEYCLRSIPFLPVGNGDFLGLDLGKADSQPPVVYMSHDGHGESCIISPSLDEFLNQWQELQYIGPALWLMDQFRDSRTGFLSAATEKVPLLSRLFDHALSG